MTSNLRYYRWAALRQLPIFLGVALLIGAMTIITARLLPPEFAPTARLLMSSNSVSQDTRISSADMAAAAHLENIETRVMTQSRLEQIGRALDPVLTAELLRESTTTKIVSGRGKATIMTVSVSSPDPDLATRATNALADEILAEHRAIRAERAQDALAFFRQEVATSKQQLDTQYNALHRFMTDNAGALPQDAPGYLSQRKDLLMRLDAKPEPIRRSAARKRLQAQLDTARATLPDQHPTVQAIVAKIRELEPKDATLGSNQMAAALTRIDDILAQIPRNELALRALNREHDRAQTLYDAALLRLDAAQTDQRIALRAEGDQLSIVEPAIRPDLPEGPRQKIIFATGAALAVVLGGLAAIFAARGDTTLRRQEDLQTGLALSPYAIIPRMQPS